MPPSARHAALGSGAGPESKLKLTDTTMPVMAKQISSSIRVKPSGRRRCRDISSFVVSLSGATNGPAHC